MIFVSCASTVICVSEDRQEQRNEYMKWCTKHWKQFKEHSKADTRNSKTKPKGPVPFNISEGNLNQYGKMLLIHSLKLKKWLW